MLVIVIISLFSLIAISEDNIKIKTPKNNFQFNTFTSAVCEEKDNLRYCRDELFVNCNGKILKADETKDCNGFKIENKVTGFAVFDKNSFE